MRPGDQVERERQRVALALRLLALNPYQRRELESAAHVLTWLEGRSDCAPADWLLSRMHTEALDAQLDELAREAAAAGGAEISATTPAGAGAWLERSQPREHSEA